MNISYREKSLWVSLLATLIVAVNFSGSVYNVFAAGAEVDQGTVSALLLKLVIAFVIVEVVLHVLLAMQDQEGADEPEDEREKQFRLKANDLGYWVLSVGVVGCIVQQLINQQLLSSGVGLPDAQPLATIAQGTIELKLAVVFWLSEVVRFGAQIYFYRKGDQ